MLIWIKRVGFLMVVISSAMIIMSYAQWYNCQEMPVEIDQSGVGFRHCYYFQSGIEVIFLLVGNVVMITSKVIEKLSGKSTP